MNHYELPHHHGQNMETILQNMPKQEQFVEVSEIFKLISDATRLKILWLLCHSEECVSNISAAMQMSDPAVSHHLRTLRKSGLIVSRRAGKEIYYTIADTEISTLVHKVCDEMFHMTCPF